MNITWNNCLLKVFRVSKNVQCVFIKNWRFHMACLQISYVQCCWLLESHRTIFIQYCCYHSVIYKISLIYVYEVIKEFNCYNRVLLHMKWCCKKSIKKLQKYLNSILVIKIFFLEKIKNVITFMLFMNYLIFYSILLDY